MLSLFVHYAFFHVMLETQLFDQSLRQREHYFCVTCVEISNFFTHLLVHHHLDRPYIYIPMNRA
jgi:hypothetical protein